MEYFVTLVLATALVVSSVTDLRDQRIPNLVTYPLMLAGLIVHGIESGPDGLLFAAKGFGLGFGLMVVPFLFGMMGAGDVKLMAGVGAWLGPDALFTAFLFTCLVGGVYALLVMARDIELLKAVLANIWLSFLFLLTIRRFRYAPVRTEKPMPRLCYGVAIAVGTGISLAVNAAQTGSLLGA